jgi:hypothetical protein
MQRRELAMDVWHMSSASWQVQYSCFPRFAYAAPEMLLGADWDYKADIYSFGVVLWCA